MYVDHDSSNKISLLEISKDECYLLTEALVKFATNPDTLKADRDKAKNLAFLISKEYEHTRETMPKHGDE